MPKLAIVVAVVISSLASFVPASIGHANSSCLESGAGAVYPGSWHALSRADRVTRCQEAERRAQERQERARDNEAAREERSRRGEAGAAPKGAADRQQECLVNAAACDTPGGSDGASTTDDSTRSRRRR